MRIGLRSWLLGPILALLCAVPAWAGQDFDDDEAVDIFEGIQPVTAPEAADRLILYNPMEPAAIRLTEIAIGQALCAGLTAGDRLTIDCSAGAPTVTADRQDYDLLLDKPIIRVGHESAIPPPDASTYGHRYQTDEGHDYVVDRITIAGVDRVIEFEAYPLTAPTEAGYQGALNTASALPASGVAGQWWLVREYLTLGVAPFALAGSNGAIQSVAYIADTGYDYDGRFRTQADAEADGSLDAMSAVIYANPVTGNSDLYRVVSATFVAGSPEHDGYVLSPTDLPRDLLDRVAALEAAGGGALSIRGAGTEVEAAASFINFTGSGVSVSAASDGDDTGVNVAITGGGAGSSDGVVTGGSVSGTTLTLTRSQMLGDVSITGLADGFDLHDDVSRTESLLANVDRFLFADEGATGDPNTYITFQNLGNQIRADIRDEGSNIDQSPEFINFTGAGIAATQNGSGVDVTVAATGDITAVTTSATSGLNGGATSGDAAPVLDFSRLTNFSGATHRSDTFAIRDDSDTTMKRIALEVLLTDIAGDNLTYDSTNNELDAASARVLSNITPFSVGVSGASSGSNSNVARSDHDHQLDTAVTNRLLPTGASDDQIAQYDSASSSWEAVDPPTGSGSGDITGVTTASNSGLAGGVTSGTATLSLDIDNLATIPAVAGADELAIVDQSDSDDPTEKVTVGAFLQSIAGDNLTYDSANAELDAAAGGGGAVAVADEGTPLVSSTTGINFTGAGVTASAPGGGPGVVVNIPGGGSGSNDGVVDSLAFNAGTRVFTAGRSGTLADLTVGIPAFTTTVEVSDVTYDTTSTADVVSANLDVEGDANFAVGDSYFFQWRQNMSAIDDGDEVRVGVNGHTPRPIRVIMNGALANLTAGDVTRFAWFLIIGNTGLGNWTMVAWTQWVSSTGGMGDITAVTTAATSGLAGGSASGDVALSLDLDGLPTATPVSADKVAFVDTGTANDPSRAATIQNFFTPFLGDNLSWDATNNEIDASVTGMGSGDITSVTTPSDSGLSGGADSGDVTLRMNIAGLNERPLTQPVVGSDSIAFVNDSETNDPTRRVTLTNFFSAIAGDNLTWDATNNELDASGGGGSDDGVANSVDLSVSGSNLSISIGRSGTLAALTDTVALPTGGGTGDITGVTTSATSGLSGGVASGTANLALDFDRLTDPGSWTVEANDDLFALYSDDEGSHIKVTANQLARGLRDYGGIGDITAVNTGTGSGLTGGSTSGQVDLEMSIGALPSFPTATATVLGEDILAIVDESGGGNPNYEIDVADFFDDIAGSNLAWDSTDNKLNATGTISLDFDGLDDLTSLQGADTFAVADDSDSNNLKETSVANLAAHFVGGSNTLVSVAATGQMAVGTPVALDTELPSAVDLSLSGTDLTLTVTMPGTQADLTDTVSIPAGSGTGDITGVTTAAGSGLAGGADSGVANLRLDIDSLTGNRTAIANADEFAVVASGVVDDPTQPITWAEIVDELADEGVGLVNPTAGELDVSVVELPTTTTAASGDFIAFLDASDASNNPAHRIALTEFIQDTAGRGLVRNGGQYEFEFSELAIENTYATGDFLPLRDISDSAQESQITVQNFCNRLTAADSNLSCNASAQLSLSVSAFGGVTVEDDDSQIGTGIQTLDFQGAVTVAASGTEADIEFPFVDDRATLASANVSNNDQFLVHSATHDEDRKLPMSSLASFINAAGGSSFKVYTSGVTYSGDHNRNIVIADAGYDADAGDYIAFQHNTGTDDDYDEDDTIMLDVGDEDAVRTRINFNGTLRDVRLSDLVRYEWTGWVRAGSFWHLQWRTYQDLQLDVDQLPELTSLEGDDTIIVEDETDDVVMHTSLDTLTDHFVGATNSGLRNDTNARLYLDVDGLASETAVATTDALALVDDSETNDPTNKITVAAWITATAGTGIDNDGAGNYRLDVDELAGITSLAALDEFPFADDSQTDDATRKVTMANLAAHLAAGSTALGTDANGRLTVTAAGDITQITTSGGTSGLAGGCASGNCSLSVAPIQLPQLAQTNLGDVDWLIVGDNSDSNTPKRINIAALGGAGISATTGGLRVDVNELTQWSGTNDNLRVQDDFIFYDDSATGVLKVSWNSMVQDLVADDSGIGIEIQSNRPTLELNWSDSDIRTTTDIATGDYIGIHDVSQTTDHFTRITWGNVVDDLANGSATIDRSGDDLIVADNSIGTGQLKTATANFTWTGSTRTSFSVPQEMAWLPRLRYTGSTSHTCELVSDTSSGTILITTTSNTLARTMFVRSNNVNGACEIAWRYMTASDDPAVWAAVRDADGAAVSVWEAEDAPPSAPLDIPVSEDDGEPMAGYTVVNVGVPSLAVITSLYAGMPVTERVAALSCTGAYVEGRGWLDAWTGLASLANIEARYEPSGRQWAARCAAQALGIGVGQLYMDRLAVSNGTWIIKPSE